MSIVTALFVILFAQSTPTWRLDDQFGRPHTSAELVGKPVLIVGGGSVAAKTFDAWIDAIVLAYGAHRDSLPFQVLGIADVGSAPRILFPLIRRRLPRHRQRPVVLDPNGTVSARYGVDRQTSNQLVLGPDGTVLLHHRGVGVDTATARAIAERLRAALASPTVTRQVSR